MINVLFINQITAETSYFQLINTYPVSTYLIIDFLLYIPPRTERDATYIFIVRKISIIGIAFGDKFHSRHATNGALAEEQAFCHG